MFVLTGRSTTACVRVSLLLAGSRVRVSRASLTRMDTALRMNEANRFMWMLFLIQWSFLAHRCMKVMGLDVNLCSTTSHTIFTFSFSTFPSFLCSSTFQCVPSPVDFYSFYTFSNMLYYLSPHSFYPFSLILSSFIHSSFLSIDLFFPVL